MFALQALALLLAVMAAGAIPLVLVAWLGWLRVPLVLRGEIALKDVALSRTAWPQRARQVANALDNQFQLPVLFYLAAAMTLLVGVGWWEAVLAWVFVASRLVHVVIHVTSNNVAQRFFAYVVGYVALLLLWGTMAVRWIAAAV